MNHRVIAVLAGAGAIVALALVAAPVFAHSRPIRFDPAPGAVLQAAPAKIDGWFNNPIRRDPNWSFVKVTDAQGARVDTGETQLSTDRKQMSITLRSGLGPGRYLVTWRTFDDNDGAIFGDCFTFYVGQAAADASATRLDGGGTCERIDVSARDGTPVPGVTPTAAAGAPTSDDNDDGASAASGSKDSGSDMPIWVTLVGIAGGLVVGLVGGKYLLAKY